MLKFGNREFRNLQEQVLKNMCDIQDIEQGATVLAAFGIKVVGQVDQVSDLPAPTTYTGNLGDAFLVGTQAPYLYYIYAKAYDGQEQPAFYNLGQFPQPGPKGDQGDAAGFGAITATATSVVGQPTVSVNTSGTNEAKNIAFEFGIPDGVKCYTGAEDISQGSTYPLNTFEGIKVGDIVSDTPSGQVFIVQYVSNSEMNLYGIATYSQQIAVTLKVQNNMWVVTSYMPEYVEANPTASATGTLQKLKVNNTVYSVGGGTKLYKHHLKDYNYDLILITTNPEPINFSSINDYDKLYNYLMSQNVIRFTTDSGDNVQFNSVQHYFYSITIELASSGLVPLINAFDDLSLVDTTDTVTEL